MLFKKWLEIFDQKTSTLGHNKIYMKQFFKFLFASMLGFIVAIFLLVIISIGIMSAFVGFSKEEVTLKDRSILELNFNYAIPERSSHNFLDGFNSMNDDESNGDGLREVIQSIQSAAKDSRVKGIYLHASYSPNSYATLEEIRTALLEFKKSKKFIIAYGEMMEEHAYYLASVADKIYLNPTGDMLFNGMSYSTVYIKGMLDKLGVEAQLIRHGKFKAAGEPLIADKMSAENREQISKFMGSMYNQYISEIAASRKLQVAEVMNISNNLLIQSGKDAVNLKMIDGLKYQDEVMDELKSKSHVEGKKDLILVSSADINSAIKSNNYSAKNKVAVIFAHGDIVSGSGDDENMGSETICKALIKARKDSSVKAIVLRVNSPGGSALASDVIWREVILTKKVKPVVVSMGNLAASGGYYIAAPANRIFAEPNTITGSIGVFGLTVNASKLLKEKLGLNFEKVNFGQYADMGSPDRPMTAQEIAIVQRMIDRIYDDFISRVAEGRHLSKAQVDSIAQGRVWTGTDAIGIKLVDEMGGLNDAINYAAKLVKIDKEYRVINLPEQKDQFEEIFKKFSKNASAYFVKQNLGEEYIQYQKLQKALKYQGIQARMLWNAEIN